MSIKKLKVGPLGVAGMALLAMAVPSFADICGSDAGNLVVNCGFETGDFTGWTLTGNTGFTGVQGNFGGVNPNSGNFQGYFGAVGSLGFLSQTLVSGASSFDLSFYLYNFGGTPSEFLVDWNGNTISDSVDPGPFGYTLFTFNGLAGSGGPTQSLEFGFQQNPSYFLLDDIEVNPSTGTPEPSSIILFGTVAALGFWGLRRRREARVN